MSKETKHTPGRLVVDDWSARLLAEARTIHHETGLTPRQLSEQRAELLGVVEALVVQLSLAGCDAVEDSNNPLEALHWRAREAVGKTTGKGLGDVIGGALGIPVVRDGEAA